MRGLAGTGCGGVSMAGGREGQGARRGKGPSLAITAMVCLEFAYVFWLSVLIRKVASEHPFCVLIYMNSYMFHIYLVVFFFLSNTYLIFDFICLTLSLADTNGSAKYARTYIRRYTHTHTYTKKKDRNSRGQKKERWKKEEGVREERKK